MSAYKFHVHGIDFVVYGSKPGRWFVRQWWNNGDEVASGPHKTRAAAIRHTTEATREAREARKQIQEAERAMRALARAERTVDPSVSHWPDGYADIIAPGLTGNTKGE